MKQIIIIISIFYSNLIFAQLKLTIVPCFCNSNNTISEFDHFTELYKNEVFITESFYPINNYTVDKLEKGKYKLKYKSIFNQEYKIEFSLKRKRKKIKICIDEFRPKKQPTYIEKLELRDTLEISSDNSGCEYNDDGTISLYKLENGIKATFVKDNIIKEKIISAKELKLLIELEQKIILVKDIEEMGYTTTFNYMVILNGAEKISTFYGLELVAFKSVVEKVFKKKSVGQ